MQSPKHNQKKARIRGIIILTVVVSLVAFFIVITVVSKNIQATYSNQSRYTYEAPISDDGSSMSDEEVASVWIDSYLSQYNKMYMPSSEGLKNITVDTVEVTDKESGTVAMSFSARLVDSSTQYFSDWGGSISGGTISCTWLGTFGIKSTDSGYVIYPTSLTVANNNQSPTINEEDDETIIRYRIADNELSVSFDAGDTYTVVPVDVRNLPLEDDDYETLKKKSYVLSDDIVVFTYGGETINGEKVPLSVIYTLDNGYSWESGEVDSVFDVDSYYIEMFSDTNGVIAIGYGINNDTEYTRIYSTTDGGTTWDIAGSGPTTELLNGFRFISNSVGFISYNVDTGNNLYMTRDGAKTFSQVSLPTGTLDDTASDKQWSDIFKIISVPVVDTDGNLIVYAAQPSDSTYHGGGTAAVYRSKDEGVTWEYVEEVSYTE